MATANRLDDIHESYKEQDSSINHIENMDMEIPDENSFSDQAQPQQEEMFEETHSEKVILSNLKESQSQVQISE